MTVLCREYLQKRPVSAIMYVYYFSQRVCEVYYGVYKGIRDGAWRCLADFEISCLPIDILSIARRSGIRVMRNCIVNELGENERGKSYFDGNEWMIIYDDSLEVAECRYAIAHELGHIFLGHSLYFDSNTGTERFKEDAVSEKHAEQFAKRLMCPACVIWALEISSPDELERRFMVPKAVAKSRWERMKILNKRNKFLTSEYERLVFKNFEDYILANRSYEEQ